jgi:gluconolactonase
MTAPVAGVSICADGLAFPEGPDVLDDGSVVFVEIFAGRISRWDPVTGRVRLVADTGGSPNAVIRASPRRAQGELYATQNGGVAGSWRSERQVPAGIQIIARDGTPRYLATAIQGIDLIAPNDLCFDDLGTLYFTDPSEGFKPGDPRATGKICAVALSGLERSWDVGPTFPNGIAWHRGRLLWSESYTCRIMALDEDGAPSLVAQLAAGRIPDGFTVDETGVMYVTTTSTGGLDIVLTDGTIRELALGPGAYTTNCCLGPDGSLYVTDAGSARPDTPDGKLWRITSDALADARRGDGRL